MPKLPDVSGKEARRALERLGFVFKRQSGSHVILRKRNRGCGPCDLRPSVSGGPIFAAGRHIHNRGSRSLFHAFSSARWARAFSKFG